MTNVYGADGATRSIQQERKAVAATPFGRLTTRLDSPTRVQPRLSFLGFTLKHLSSPISVAALPRLWSIVENNHVNI